MLKQILAISVLVVSCKTKPQDSNESEVSVARQSGKTKTYDFLDAKKSFKSEGFDFYFSDVPSNQKLNANDLSKFKGATLVEKMTNEIASAGGPSQYQLRQVYDANANAKGQAIGYHNRSDDIDTNIVIKISDDGSQKLKPNTIYKISAKIDFSTNMPSSSVGVGGSGSSNSYGLLVVPNPIELKPETISNNKKGPREHLGKPSKFFWEDDSAGNLAPNLLKSLSSEELQILKTRVGKVPDGQNIEKATLQALTSLITDTWQNKYLGEDALTKKVVAAIDARIDALIADMSPEEQDAIKGAGGAANGGPVAFGANANTGVTYMRTYTKDENGKEIRIGVPAGDCTSVVELDKEKKWVCSHYSFMGRIQNGKDAVGWANGSISTQKPLEFKTDSKGSPVYANLTSHSGFEGLTLFYIRGIQITITQ